MKRPTISKLRAMEILDSRRNPTVRVFVELSDGTESCASVPSGASMGENEAVELRDRDNSRYAGKGVIKAVSNVREIIGPSLIGMDASEQAVIDRLMIEMDGAENKSKLGGALRVCPKAPAQSTIPSSAIGCVARHRSEGHPI